MEDIINLMAINAKTFKYKKFLEETPTEVTVTGI
jgi:hypothetical protein